MNSIKKKMKFVCKRIVVLLLAFCLIVTGSVFFGGFGKNNKAAAGGTADSFEVLGDGDWATLQAKLYEGGYYILGANFIDTSANSGNEGTRVDYKAVYNVDRYSAEEYPHYNGCGPLLIIHDTTIDLNGHTIDRNRGTNFHTYGMVFWIKNGAKLTIIDSSDEKSGVITGAKNKGSANEQNQPLSIDQDRVNKYFDQELKTNETGENRIPHECQITYGGAFYVEDGALILQGGNVNANADSFMDGKKGIGAGVYIGENSTLNMSSDVIFSGNNADGNNNSLESAISVNENATAVEVSLNVTIIGKINETQYDGKKHTVSGYTVESNLGDGKFQSNWVKLKQGNKASAAQTDVGTTMMGLVADKFDVNPQQDRIVYSVKSVTVVDGYQTIIPRAVTLTSATESKEYDGTPLTNNTVIVSGDGFVAGEGCTFNVTGAITKVGSVNNSFTYILDAGTKAGNYTIITDEGTLSVSKNLKDIVITSSTNSWTYDGQTHKDESYSVTFDGTACPADASGKAFTLPTGDKVTITATAPGVKDYDAGYEKNNTYTYELENAENYSSSINADCGTLSIIRRPITIKANDATSEYNGSGITYATATSAVPPYYSITNTAENEGLAPGQSITSIELSGNGTAVYEYTINITPGSVIIGNYTSNYNISLESGTLSITKNTTEITVTPGSDSKVYDGTPLTKNGHDDFTVTGVPEGFTWTAKANGTVTNVTPGEGEKSENAVTEFKIFNANGEDVTEQFSNIDTSATGTLKITKRAVTLTSEYAEKPYDGTSLTKQGVTVGGDGFVAGEVSEIKATGSVTTVAEGEVTNTITFTEGASFKAENYSITKNEGTLKITANMRTVVITSASKSWTYDGQTHTDEVYTVTYDGTACTADASGKVFTLPIGDTLTITPTAEGVKDYNSSLDENNTYSYSITNANSYGDVTANYGTLSITKCPLTIKADNKTKVYDNDAATDPKLTATVTGVVSGDTINYTLSRAEGQNVGEYAITVTSGNNPNYVVTVEAGTFSITAKEVALTWSDTEFPYDGKSHAPVATVSNLADGDTCEVTIDGAQTEIGDDYTANATALSNPNYKLPADASTKFKIYGCTITFVDEDGTELQSGIVEYGTKPSYTGKTPVKAATAQYSYEFLDWSPTITEVTGDKTYTATYKPILNAYTVTWKDEDGTILETDKDVPYGTVPTYDGKEPTKAATAEYSFKFDGWSIAVAEVTGDITYTATYAKSAIEYTVEAENLPEGTQLSFSGKETVEAGKVLTFKVLLADGYEASKDLVVTVNGTKIAPNADGSYTIPSVMTNSLISVTGVVKVDYNLTEGENAEYKQGDSKNARFVFKRTVNDKVTFGRFTYAELDGKLLDPNNYTKVSGSLILELKKEFLDTLPAGEHLLKVYFSDDKEGVIAHFLISAGITPTVTVTVTPAPDSNPTTGDTSNPILWVLLIGAAVLGLIGMVYSRSRMER